ncbi:MAG TPA: CaiB/BaiF CoA-transferase family protein [Hyphomicrobiaceae bacterium]|nr:CaiB/BaiF CoA-transferase family protein [Hyphomicrobiaceae bacterium]
MKGRGKPPRPTATSYPKSSTALEGLVVLDLTHVRAGPVCVRQLADWGANVIRIERPGHLDDFSARSDSDFINRHRNKRSVSINLRDSAGREVLLKLARRADVLVENFRPDVKHRLGIDYETLKVVNPRLVYVSISAFGQDGPYRDRPGVDQIIQGMSGLMSITGEPDREPMRVGFPISDVIAGLCAALGIFVALIERQKSGEGQWVQTSLLEAQMFALDLQAARYLVDGVVAQRVGNEHPTGVPTNTYRTKDGYINVAPIPAMWPRFCRALGREDLIDHPDYSTRERRRKHRVEVNALVQEIIAQMDSKTAIARLMQHEIPCGPIYTIGEAFEDPQAKHLALSQTVTKDGRELALPRQPFTLSRTPSRLASGPPEFAEHTREVLAEFGFSPNDIEELAARGAIQ